MKKKLRMAVMVMAMSIAVVGCSVSNGDTPLPSRENTRGTSMPTDNASLSTDQTPDNASNTPLPTDKKVDNTSPSTEPTPPPTGGSANGTIELNTGTPTSSPVGDENSGEPTSDVNPMQPPEYEPLMFRTVDEMISWIRKADISHQGGRFKSGLTKLKSDGKIMGIAFDDPSITLRWVELLSDNRIYNGNPIITYYFFKDKERIAIQVSETGIEKEGDLSKYLYSLQTTLPTMEFDVQEKIQIDDKKATVPYAILDAEKSAESGAKITVMLYNGFDVRAHQSLDTWGEKYLCDMRFDVVTVGK